ncbi:MAG: NAD(P)H-hydrate epimerase, partial [Pseudomonadota bacterium]
MRELDRLCIERHGIAGYELMQRAGLALFKRLMSRYPDARSLIVCCGAGNNGGDGYVIARLARQQGMIVRLIALSDPSHLRGDAAQAARDFLADGGEVLDTAADLTDCDLIVDALLGTGLDREVQ